MFISDKFINQLSYNILILYQFMNHLSYCNFILVTYTKTLSCFGFHYAA